MAPPATVSYVYGYKVATRPRSAPFSRAGPANAGAALHPPLWRSLPGSRKPTGRKGCSPRLRPPSSRERAASQDSISTDAEAPPEGGQRSAREWHVPDHQIERLVEQLQEDALASSVSSGGHRPWARRAVVSPCQVNRPLLCCGRLKKPKEPEVETPSRSSVDAEAELWAARAAKDDHEVAEMERIKYFFRKPMEREAVSTPEEMARCASAPSRRGPGTRPQKLTKSTSEVLLTLNFMDTGDKYTIFVDPDLRIGPSAETSGLKGIIEEITGVSSADQILFCKRSKMGNDRHTLRSYHAHDNAEVLVRFKQQRSKFPQACTVKWRQQQEIRSQRRDRAREYSTSRGGKHRVQQCWQSCVVPQNGTYFQYAKRGIEGPGTYHPKHLPSGAVAMEVQPPLKPILQDIAKTTPSVPPMRYLPGQVPQTEAAIADLEKLSSRHTGEPGDIAGPGTYEITSDLIKESPVTIFRKPPGSGRAYRKLWEASAHIESTMPDKTLPGPGTYETPMVKHAEPKGAASRFNSKVPKMPDPKENAKTPGPGAYDVLGHIEMASTETQERCEAIALSLGFGSLTERVGWSREVEHPYADSYNVTHVPGPGHYGDSVKESEDQEKVIPKRKKLYGVHHPTLLLALQETEGPLQAFNTSDDRPCNKDLEQWTPAPWQYMPESARGSSMNSDLKERAKVGRRGVFGTCADRFYRSPLNAKEGPENDWDGGKANMSKDPTSPEARSSFKSTSPRMREGAKEVEIVTLGDVKTPAPGDYEIKEPNYRSPYRIPRSEHLFFGSGKTRFTEKQEVFADFQPFDGPAPTDYTIASKRHVQGGARLKDKRKPMLVGSTTSSVGPGSYCDNIETMLLKKTFNVTTQVGPGSYCDNIETMLLKKTFNVTTQGRSVIAQKALPAPE